MFEKGIRLKLRFNYKGLCSIEDLYDLIPNDLKSIYVELNRGLKEYKDGNLDDEKDPNEEILELKAAIVKHIFKIKKEEQLNRELEKARLDKKQRLLGIYEEGEYEEFRGMSKEDQIKIINEL